MEGRPRPERTFFQNYCLQRDGDLDPGGGGDDEQDQSGQEILNDVDNERSEDVDDLNEDVLEDNGIQAEDEDGDDVDDEGMDDPTDDEVEDDEVVKRVADRGYSKCAKIYRKKKKVKQKQSHPHVNQTKNNTKNADAADTAVQAGDRLDFDKDVEQVWKKGCLFYSCPCGKGYKSLGGIKKHFDIMHTGKPAQFRCGVCDKPFYYKQQHVAHCARNFCHRDWSETKKRPHTQPRKEPPYEGGPRMDFSALSPAEIFIWLLRLVLPIWILHTEHYGRNKFTDRKKRWKEFTMANALRWIALYLARGVLKLHRITSPWRQHGLFANSYFVSNMAGNTWYQILRATCFTDRETEVQPGGRGDLKNPKMNRLWRVIDVIVAFTESSQNAFHPFKELCIDEMMTKFLGWFQWTQTIPNKPIKSGIKSFVLSDARTGYVLGFIPAVKQPFRTFAYFGATASAVWALLTSELLTFGHNYLHKGHFLFTDSYYTMLSLIEKLYTCATYYCGTISKARQLPPGFVDKQLSDGTHMERGDSKHLHTEFITLTHWIDNGSVRIASSLPHITDDPAEVTRKIRKDNGKWVDEKVSCPKVVTEYNKFMGGVDLADQLLASSHVQIRQVRWYMTIWFRILEIAMINAFIIFQYTFGMDHRLSKNRLAFHVDVIEGLLAKADELDGRKRMDDDDKCYNGNDEEMQPKLLNLRQVKRNNGLVKSSIRFSRRFRHFPTIAKRGSCVVHGRASNVKTQYSCRTCRVRLCIPVCYERWHTLAKYSF